MFGPGIIQFTFEFELMSYIFHLGIFNRILSEDELALYSDCSKHADKSGDLINSSSAVKVKYYKY